MITQMVVTRANSGGVFLVFPWLRASRFIPRAGEIKQMIMAQNNVTIENMNGEAMSIAPCYDDFPSPSKIRADILALAAWLLIESPLEPN